MKFEISNRQSGYKGEREVIDMVPCPNCGKELMPLPPGYPLFDVQCTGCSFRAQVKTNASKAQKRSFWCRLGYHGKGTEVRIYYPANFCKFQMARKIKK